MSDKYHEESQDSESSNSGDILQHIGKYEIQGMLGRGSTGVVYLGFDPQLQRKVAIKVLHVARSTVGGQSGDIQGNQQIVKRFMAEAHSAGRLRHQNIIALHEGNVHGPVPYLVMEYVEGTTLDALIKAGQRFSNPELLALLHQLADAIDYAHSQGVLHRDVKPANILIDSKYKPYILDFGVAKIHEQISAEDEGVRATSVLGTPAYMSPEQIRNKPLNNQSDLFAFAIVVFQCLCGVRPFDGDTFTAVAASILDKFPKQVTSYRPDLSPDVDQVFLKALAKDRSGRFESAHQFINALEKALKSSNFGSTHLNNANQGEISPGSVAKDLEVVKTLAVRAAGINSEKFEAKPAALEHKLSSASRIKAPIEESKPKSGSSLSLFFFFVGLLIGVSCIGAYFLWPRRIVVLISGQEIHAAESNNEKSELSVLTDKVDSSISIAEQELKQREEATSVELVNNIVGQAADSAQLTQLLSELKARSLLNYDINVTPLLQHSNYLVKVAALKILIEKKEAGAVSSIVALLEDSDPIVRGFAAKALGVLAGANYSEVLARRASKETVPEVIRALENAIERIAERAQ